MCVFHCAQNNMRCLMCETNIFIFIGQCVTVCILLVAICTNSCLCIERKLFVDVNIRLI